MVRGELRGELFEAVHGRAAAVRREHVHGRVVGEHRGGLRGGGGGDEARGVALDERGGEQLLGARARGGGLEEALDLRL